MILVPTDAVIDIKETGPNLPDISASTSMRVQPTTRFTTPWRVKGPIDILPIMGPNVICDAIQVAEKREMRASSFEDNLCSASVLGGLLVNSGSKVPLRGIVFSSLPS